MNDEIREHYRLLELEPGAPIEAVKAAYRELLKVWHPDRFPNDPGFQARATQKTAAINEAYEKISAYLARHSTESRAGATAAAAEREAARQARGAAEAKGREEARVKAEEQARRQGEAARQARAAAAAKGREEARVRGDVPRTKPVPRPKPKPARWPWVCASVALASVFLLGYIAWTKGHEAGVPSRGNEEPDQATRVAIASAMNRENALKNELSGLRQEREAAYWALYRETTNESLNADVRSIDLALLHEVDDQTRNESLNADGRSKFGIWRTVPQSPAQTQRFSVSGALGGPPLTANRSDAWLQVIVTETNRVNALQKEVDSLREELSRMQKELRRR
ncbi:MAG: J domain-containing protein [Verrucomicrobiota bacterium]|jgi:hypothetical protein